MQNGKKTPQTLLVLKVEKLHIEKKRKGECHKEKSIRINSYHTKAVEASCSPLVQAAVAVQEGKTSWHLAKQVKGKGLTFYPNLFGNSPPVHLLLSSTGMDTIPIFWSFCCPVESVNSLLESWSSNFVWSLNWFWFILLKTLSMRDGGTDGRGTTGVYCENIFFPQCLWLHMLVKVIAIVN